MIIALKKDAKLKDIDALTDALLEADFTFETVQGQHYTVLHILGDTTAFDGKKLYAYDCVDRIINIQEPFIRAHKKNHPNKTIITIGDVAFGSNTPVIIAGPCSVENHSQIMAIAKAVKASGANILRGGAYKPRTSPYAFQGLKEEGLQLLHDAAKTYNLKTISEIVAKEDLPYFDKYIDIIQVGARNMQNFDLLKALGKAKQPILLKRGFGNTIEEWLMSAEYIMNHGNNNVILCERGIRTFEGYTRTTLDISSILAVKQLSHLPVIVDPSHAAGRWELVEGLSKASIAAGADGLMIEVHNAPKRALSDGAQSLKLDKFQTLMNDLTALMTAIKKT